MGDGLEQELAQRFGFDQFRPGQKASIQALLAGQSTLAVLPTGTGKTLIYQFVAAHVSGPVLIISPLLSLMQDQVDRLMASGIKHVVALTSRTSFAERQQVLQQLEHYDFIYMAPEMLAQPAVLDRLKQVSLGLLVIDEAHCISQWGPDFRPEYLLLGSIRQMLHHPLTLMLTATASQQTQTDILQRLHLPQAQRVVYSANRPNILLDVEQVQSPQEKLDRLTTLVAALPGSGIVYFMSKRQAETVAAMLRTNTTRSVAAYHAGLDADTRFKIQQQFMLGDLDIICATSAFGMGIDKADIRFVIHFHLPVDLESYIQEIGRAGRDNQAAVAILLYQDGDERLALELVSANIPTSAEIHAAYQLTTLDVAKADASVQLIQFYRQQGMSEAALIQLFAQRLAHRLSGVRRLVAYAQTTDCLRANLLAPFDDSVRHQAVGCCSPAGVTLDLTTMDWPDRPQTLRRKPVAADWRARLEQLFLPES